MKDSLKVGIAGVLTFAPFLAFAATLGSILNTIGQLIQTATPIVVALALVYFFWGLGQFILGSSDSEKRKNAIEIMIYGIIALFIMVSIWGIINVLQSTFQIDDSGSITPPSVQI